MWLGLSTKRGQPTKASALLTSVPCLAAISCSARLGFEFSLTAGAHATPTLIAGLLALALAALVLLALVVWAARSVFTGLALRVLTLGILARAGLVLGPREGGAGGASFGESFICRACCSVDRRHIQAYSGSVPGS